jgi:hypothetical protein
MRGKANRVRTMEESWNLWYITGSGRYFSCTHTWSGATPLKFDVDAGPRIDAGKILLKLHSLSVRLSCRNKSLLS